MMNVRFAHVWELEAGIPAGKLFEQQGNFPGGFDVSHFIHVWTHNLRSGCGKIVAAFDERGTFCGALGGTVSETDFSPTKIAMQRFWFALPQHRAAAVGLKLVAPFEGWAKEQGAKFCVLNQLHSNGQERPSGGYERMGYRKIETRYVKELCHS